MKTLFHYMLALGMLITGSINTLSTKAADQEYTVDRYGDTVQFDHPFFQAVCMFLGEFLCLIAFNALLFRARSKGESFPTAKPHSRFIFILPAVCDMTATSLMYVGLTLTDASIFQMLRGSVVIFTGVFSVIFLKRKLHAHHWLGMVLVMGGTAIVGTASLPSVCASAGGGGSTDASKALVGNILVIVAQLIVATQMVVEEYMIGGYDIPALQVVGWEGTWGFIVLSCVLGIMYAVPAPATFCAYPPHCDHFEDAYDAFVQIGNNWKVGLYLGLNICSIAFFNYLGVSITKHINASTRMVLDSMRTLIVWAFSMGVKWEAFCYVQIIGFVTLLSGTLIYNEIVRLPCLKYPVEEDKAAPADSVAGLLEEGEDYSLLAGSVNADADAYPVKSIKGRK